MREIMVNARRRRQCSLNLTVLVGFTCVIATTAWGHEGHAPLPTKGAQVDLEKGSLILSREARDALNVQTAEVTIDRVEEIVLAYAVLVAPWRQHAFATTKMSGRVDNVHAKTGQHVVAGQLLAELDSVELESLRLEIRNAANEIQLSERKLEQVAELGRDGALSGRDVRERKSKHQENLNALEIAKRKWLCLGLSEKSFENLLTDGHAIAPRLPVISPITGVLIHAELAAGQLVEPTEHLFEIMDLSTVWVKIGVLEKDVYRIKAGQDVEISLAAYSGENFPGKVQVVDAYFDPQTHLGTVWTELKNPPGIEARFLPGMHGRAKIVVADSDKSVTIPAAALLNDGVDRFVLVEEEATSKGSQYRKRNVVTGIQSAAKVAIREGAVFPGDQVVTLGSHELATLFFQGILRLSAESAKNYGIQVEPVEARIVEEVLEVNAQVEVPPERKATASAPLTGVIENIRIERGQSVRAGEILAEIDSLEFQNLQLEIYQVHLQLELMQETLRQLRELDRSQVLARRQLWEAENLYNTLTNRQETAKKKLDTLGASAEQVESILEKKEFLKALPLRSPIDGVIVQFDKALGQAVKAGDPVFEVHDLSHAWVQGFVSEADLHKIRIGQTARVRFTALPTLLAVGTVVRSSRIVGPETGSLSVWVELKDQPEQLLRHNMLAQLSITVGRPAATLAVPQQAIVHEGTRTYVFVRRPDGVFERRAVQLGRSDDRYEEITSGLSAGENVAVRGAADLQTALVSLR